MSDGQAAEMMSRPLPKGWRWIPLGQYVENHDGRRVPISRSERESRLGAFPYYGASGVIDTIDGYTHDGEFVLIGEDGANLLTRSKPLAFLTRGKVWVNNHAHVLRCKPGFSNAYLAYYINSINLSAYVTGTAQPKLSQSMMNKIPIPVAPPEQQIEIVAELEKQFSRLDEAVANLQRVKANLKRYKASVLKAAVEGRLVETEATLACEKQKKFESATELLQQAFHGRRLKTFSAPEQGFAALPEGWAWASVEQLAATDANSIGAGPFGTIFKAKDFRSEGVPIIFLRHVSPLKYLTHKPGFMDVGKWEELFRPYSVFGGELLITKLGEPPGVCAQYPVGIGPAMVTPDVIKLSVNNQLVSSEYLMYYFNSDPAKRFATGAAFGTTRTRLTLPLFREMPVPLPPMAEQVRIIDEVDRHLSILREVETEVDANLQRAQALRQSVLQRAFSTGSPNADDLQPPR